MNNLISLKGALNASLKKADGSVEKVNSKNMILNSGFELLAQSIIAGTRPDALSMIAVGTQNTSVNATQVGLGEEIARKDATATYDADTKSITFTAAFKSDVTGAIVEAGVCNPDGVFLDRSIFPVLNKDADDELVIKFIISFSEE